MGSQGQVMALDAVDAEALDMVEFRWDQIAVEVQAIRSDVLRDR